MFRTSGRRLVSPLVLALGSILLGNTASGTVTVGGTVVARCTVTTLTFAFGSYDVLSGSAVPQSFPAIGVSCTRGATGVTIALDNGLNSTHAVGTTRAMNSGTNYLSYELYTSSAMTTVWNATNTVSYSPITSMAQTSFIIYGQIPGSQDVAVGSYSDTVTVTVNY